VIYWDTSCVIKLYTQESDSLHWQKLAVAETGKRVASSLLEVELAFALRQKELRMEVTSGGTAALIRLFRHDVNAGRFTLFPLGADVIHRATLLADEAASTACGLRTLDGLHLATAAILRCSGIATTDTHMRAGAQMLGIPLV
jgi:predicted nucleic acid-binding protein